MKFKFKDAALKLNIQASALNHMRSDCAIFEVDLSAISAIVPCQIKEMERLSYEKSGLRGLLQEMQLGQQKNTDTFLLV